ncbi:MAG TPA: sialidase family protein [Thermoanaerobaculia bacterium]|nr:sialidase family protein [Thermoanaerobaculia bacterium]
MSRPRILLIQVLLVGAAAVGALRAHRWAAPASFAVPSVARTNEPPLLASELLPSSGTNFVHAATLAELPNGDLLAAWYGGTDEIDPDVNIFVSRQDRRTGRWSAPRAIENGPRTHVKSVGNPVLVVDRDGVRLFYVGVILGGWSGSTIFVKRSPDGEHWSTPRRIATSPLLNLGMLVRSPAAAYNDGTIGLPIYHELRRKWSALARVDGQGRVVDEVRMADNPFIQPWVVPTSARDAIAFFRWSARAPGFVNSATTADGGVRWSPLASTGLEHRDSAVAAARLDDGSLIAIFNNSPGDRRKLAIVRKGGRWSKPFQIENDPRPAFDGPTRREYSYPFLIATRDGRYHVVYTWQRTKIKHVVFNAPWVRAALP